MLNRRRRRPLYVDVHLPPMRRRTKLAIVLVLIAAVLVSVGIRGAVYLRELSCSMVLSDATDLMTLCINDTISRKLASEDYDYDYFVTLEHDAEGSVTAVRANMARINAMSSELLSDIVKAADGGELSLEIPIGNLLGSSLLLGRGPDIPVDITMLSSSRVDFKNELVSAGINRSHIRRRNSLAASARRRYRHRRHHALADRLYPGRQRDTHRRDRHSRPGAADLFGYGELKWTLNRR